MMTDGGGDVRPLDEVRACVRAGSGACSRARVRVCVHARVRGPVLCTYSTDRRQDWRADASDSIADSEDEVPTLHARVHANACTEACTFIDWSRGLECADSLISHTRVPCFGSAPLHEHEHTCTDEAPSIFFPLVRVDVALQESAAMVEQYQRQRALQAQELPPRHRSSGLLAWRASRASEGLLRHLHQ